MIRDHIFDRSPYEGFVPPNATLTCNAETHPVFREVFRHARPRTILEVGTWKGSSAILMATLCKEMGLDGAEIVCIDTWLGSHEMWEDRTPGSYWGYDSLGLEHGFPSVYRQFLGNVVLSGHADVITPFPVSSNNAAVFLARKGVTADLIYIDGGHDYRDVKSDIDAYWPLVRPGGVLLGDDYHAGGPGVIRAADEFAATAGLRLVPLAGKWMVLKPAAG